MGKYAYAFKEDFWRQKLAEFSVKDMSKGNCEIKRVSMSGRMDGYCHKMLVSDEMIFPVLKIDGEIVMSVMPMDIESHVIPIELANGVVGVGGLGLGYYVQNILDLDRVEAVIVYEINQNIIDMYLKNFGEHEKLTIVKQDVRTVKGEVFDFFYNDIYPQVVNLEVFDDRELILQNNDISQYHFWTQEYVIYELLCAKFNVWEYEFGIFATQQNIDFLMDLVELWQGFLVSGGPRGEMFDEAFRSRKRFAA